MLGKPYLVNRHTGGLEIQTQLQTLIKHVNRHTGGLESIGNRRKKTASVNRHTGGLENLVIYLVIIL